jgi:1-acyl-sn-glycerol-3-phosphate acyltransferase
MFLLRAVYSVYVGLLFLLGVISVIPAYFVALLALKEPHRLGLMFAANRRAMLVWSFLTGIRVRVDGRAAWGQSVIMTGNHCNMLDMPVCAIACAGPVKVLAKAEFARIPFLGFLFRSFAVLVTRESADSRRAGAKALAEALEQGWSVLLFPEGTRNRTSEPLQPFRDGAFRAAIASGKPIQPFVQINSRGAQIFNTLLFRPNLITFRWLPLVPTAGLTEDDIPALRDKVYGLIEAELRRDDPAFQPR